MANTVKVPKYSLHKPSGRAVVKIQRGKPIYLGKYDSPESREEYARIVADLLAGREYQPNQPTKIVDLPPTVTIAELAAQHLDYAATYYQKAGEPTSEVAGIQCAVKYLLAACADMPASSFTVGALRATRQRMIDANLSRCSANKYTGRIVRMFRWAAEIELIQAGVWSELQSLTGLKAGRSTVKETAPVEPVEDAIVDKTLPELSPTIAAMVKLQRATGMRPNEVCQVRPGDIDRSGEVWLFTPGKHKTEHHGKSRVIPIGPRGQDILRPFLLRPGKEYCFRPNRGTLNPRKDRRYRVDSYRHAIRRACDRAFRVGVGLSDKQAKEWRREHRWTPNQLRHTYATEVRAEHGLEAAQVLLGHSSANVTQVYAERDLARGLEVASLIG